MANRKKVVKGSQTIQLSTKAKRRMRASREELAILESHYTKNNKPTKEQEASIAKLVNMEPKNVYFWFQNRRAKDKKNKKAQQKERDSRLMINLSSQSSGTDTRHYSKESYERLLSDQAQLEELKANLSRKASARLPPISTILGKKKSQEVGLDVQFVYHHSIFGIEAAFEQWERLTKV
ncbi:hypothetical protein K501DRAFT_275585 [Backusella circina FSU 941]|nr:hypothetical protein K501DRAFT_275585 [Backusella circina FSU 941]